MSQSRYRLPSNEDLILVFGFCAFIIHLWALYNLFYTLPAWTLRLSLNDLIGAISYVLVFALIETIIFWGMLTLAAVLLPATWFRQYYLVQSAIFIFLTTILAIILQFAYAAVAANIPLLAGFILAYLVITAISFSLLRKSQRAESLWRKILQMTVVPAALYLPFDLIGLVVIIFRNIL